MICLQKLPSDKQRLDVFEINNVHDVHKYKIMTKKLPKKASEKQITKVFSSEETKAIAIASIQRRYGVSKPLKELAEQQLSTIVSGEQSTDEAAKNLMSVSRAYSLESGHALMESTEEQYGPLALQMKTELEREFGCKTPSERALTDQIVISYIRKLSFSRFLEEKKEQRIMSTEKVGYLNFISKEIDRAHRQFLSALETLRVMRQPTLKVNVRAQNAFVGENQQFNNNQSQKNESK